MSTITLTAPRTTNRHKARNATRYEVRQRVRTRGRVRSVRVGTARSIREAVAYADCRGLNGLHGVYRIVQVSNGRRQRVLSLAV